MLAQMGLLCNQLGIEPTPTFGDQYTRKMPRNAGFFLSSGLT